MASKTGRKLKPQPFKEKTVATKTTDEISGQQVASALLPWLTLETLLYGVIFVLALGLRLWKLGAYPLSNVEAEQSLVALALYRGHLPEPGQYSPLLVSLNTLTFLLFGSSDASARLAPVLLGSALVLLPLTLRRQLGPPVCLLASALLAISPVGLYLSRTLNDEVGLAVGALMIVSGFFNWASSQPSTPQARQKQQRWLLVLAAGLALLLAAGPMAYSILLVFGLIVLVKFSAFKALWSGKPPASQHVAGTVQSRTSQASISKDLRRASNPQSPIPVLSEVEEPNPQPLIPNPQSPEGTMSPISNPHLGQAGLFFLVTLILLSTTALFNLSGFSVLTASFLDWLSRFSFRPRSDAGFNAVFLLTIYEPLLVFAGLTGLALIIVRGNLLKMVFGGWFVGLLLIDVLMAGRPNGHVILLLVPLAFLAALALAELWSSVQKYGTWQNEGLLLVSGLAIAGFAYIGLTGWLARICSAEDLPCQYAWLQSVAALILFAVIVAFFAMVGDTSASLRGAVLAGVAVGLLVTINIGWRLNYGRLMDLAYQPLAGIPPSTGLVALTETLADQSEWRVGDETLLDITLVGVTSPALRWQLRDYRHLTQAGSIAAPSGTTALITPVTNELGLEQPYIGQSFALDAVWSPVGLQPKELIYWLIYRRAASLPQGNQVVLWLRLEEGGNKE